MTIRKSIKIDENTHRIIKNESLRKNKTIGKYVKYLLKKELSRKDIRKKLEEKYGLELKKGEGVHHIDMDKTNNSYENLWGFKNNSEHMKAHYSIFKLVPKLIRRGIIVFDEWEGKYKFKRRLDYDDVVFTVGDFKIKESEFRKLSDRKKKEWYDLKKIYEEEDNNR